MLMLMLMLVTMLILNAHQWFATSLCSALSGSAVGIAGLERLSDDKNQHTEHNPSDNSNR